MIVIIWRGNPSSGGTGFHGTGAGPLEAFIDAKQQHQLPSRVYRYMARASSIILPIVRLGDTEWSVEIRREGETL